MTRVRRSCRCCVVPGWVPRCPLPRSICVACTDLVPAGTSPRPPGPQLPLGNFTALAAAGIRLPRFACTAGQHRVAPAPSGPPPRTKFPGGPRACRATTDEPRPRLAEGTPAQASARRPSDGYQTQGFPGPNIRPRGPHVVKVPVRRGGPPPWARTPLPGEAVACFTGCSAFFEDGRQAPVRLGLVSCCGWYRSAWAAPRGWPVIVPENEPILWSRGRFPFSGPASPGRWRRAALLDLRVPRPPRPVPFPPLPASGRGRGRAGA